jgi:AcrR family transcriptional regulator
MSGPDRKGVAARARILAAARTVFATAGLEGASLRAIAAEAGYTPAALYFHFASREAIYAELLRESLEALEQALAPAQDFRTAALALYDFYATRPQELWLGLYLGVGGPAPRGLGAKLDPALNARLLAAMAPLTEGARALGEEALAARAFAQVVGLVVLAETRRLRLFGRDPRALMAAELEAMLFGKAPPPR